MQVQEKYVSILINQDLHNVFSAATTCKIHLIISLFPSGPLAGWCRRRAVVDAGSGDTVKCSLVIHNVCGELILTLLVPQIDPSVKLYNHGEGPY